MVAEVDRAKLIEHILDLSEKLERVMRPIVPKEWLTVDLTMPQLRVLLILLTEGPARMSALASSLGVTLATATGIVDRLVERDFLLRESLPEDRRVVICRLSDKGQKLVRRLWQLGRAQVKRVLEMMTPSQLQIVARGTEAFIQVATTLNKCSNSKE